MNANNQDQGQHWLQQSLERDREAAHEIAQYQRTQRDALTTQIRVGLVTLNGASIVALLSLSGGATEAARMLGFYPWTLLFSLCAFIIGAIAAGQSLSEQQTLLIKLAGYTGARARTLDAAVGLAALPHTSERYQRLPELMNRAAKFDRKSYKYSKKSFTMQGVAAVAWLAGVCAPIVSKLISLI